MTVYETLSQGINDLKSRGFNIDFNLAGDCIECVSDNIRLHPEDFEIVETYRFEGMTNPSDSSILFAIESKDGKHKGVFVDAFGAYSTELSEELKKKLSFHSN